MKPQEVHTRPGSVSGQPRPSSVYDAGSPMRAGYRTAVNLASVTGGEAGEFLPQRPYSSQYPGPHGQLPSSPVRQFPSSPTPAPQGTQAPPSPSKQFPVNTATPHLAPPTYNNTRPLDRPTHVRRSVTEAAP